MGLWKRSAPPAGNEISHSNGKDAQAIQDEKSSAGQSSGFKLNKAGDGDEALNLFSSTADVREPIDPLEEKKVVRKIDLMILPVCQSQFRSIAKSADYFVVPRSVLCVNVAKEHP